VVPSSREIRAKTHAEGRQPAELRHLEQGGQLMKQKLSDDEGHARYCPIKNVKSALFLVVSFSVIAFVGWKGLDKPPTHYRLDQLVIVIFVVAMLARLLGEFTCFRERFLLAIIIISLMIMEVQGFVPSVFSKHVELVKSLRFALDLVGLLVSVTMLIDAARSPNAGPSDPRTGGTAGAAPENRI
jgi:hypothetical protein